MKLFSDVLTMMSKFVIAGGGFWLVWGVIILAGGLKDKNGPALQSGIWQVIGGGMVIAAAALFTSVASPAELMGTGEVAANAITSVRFLLR